MQRHVIITVITVITVTTVTLLAARAAHADVATATAAFQQAEELAKANQWEQACPLYEASYKADPQLGALLYLAECHDKIGKTATAWSQFNDAIDLARAKNDPREARIRARADAILPRLAKLRITFAAKVPDEKVLRGGTDITVLAGSDVPLDPGPHDLVVSAPGYTEWRTTITIEPGKLATLAIPALVKAAVPVEPPRATPQATITIRAQQDAKIYIDGELRGTGTFTGTLAARGYTLRVVAPGRRPYQDELTVTANVDRTVPIELDPDSSSGMITLPLGPREELPAFELGASIATGVKLREDNPLVVAARAELAFRFGRRVNFGLVVDYGTIDNRNACGFSMPGAMPATPFDFGVRNQFTRCAFVMPALQLLVHILPKQRFDPYIGVTPGFRFGFTRWTPTIDGEALAPRDEIFPAIVVGTRAGVNYHPLPALPGFVVGAFVEASITAFGDETSEHTDDSSATQFVTMFAGLRGAVAF